MLRNHLKEYGTGPGGRVFGLPRGGIVTDRAYLAVFHRARAAAFTEAEAASLVARRPYDLRHAAVSTWKTPAETRRKSPNGQGTP